MLILYFGGRLHGVLELQSIARIDLAGAGLVPRRALRVWMPQRGAPTILQLLIVFLPSPDRRRFQHD